MFISASVFGVRVGDSKMKHKRAYLCTPSDRKVGTNSNLFTRYFLNSIRKETRPTVVLG